GIAAGAPGVRGGGALQGLAAGHGDEGVVGGVEALDAVEEVAGQLDAGEFATGEAGAQLREGLVMHGGYQILWRESCWESRVGGAMAWKASRGVGSVTGSGRRRCTASRGWAMGAMPVVSAAWSWSTSWSTLPRLVRVAVMFSSLIWMRASSASFSMSDRWIVMV